MSGSGAEKGSGAMQAQVLLTPTRPSDAAVGFPSTGGSLRAAEAVGGVSSDLSSCGSDIAQLADSSVHSSGSELDDEFDGLGLLDENQKTVAHWLRTLGMLEYWPQFFEHELCDMVSACVLSRHCVLLVAKRVLGFTRPCIAQEAVLHVTAAELREIGCKPGHIKKFMKRLMDLQTVVLTKNEAAVREWVYSLRPRRGADGSVPAPTRRLSKSSSSPQRSQRYVSLRTLRRQGSLTDELDSIHERHPSCVPLNTAEYALRQCYRLTLIAVLTVRFMRVIDSMSSGCHSIDTCQLT